MMFNRLLHIVLGVMVMVFNATFNNISVISWLSILLVEETVVPGVNYQPALTNFISYCCIEFSWAWFELITLVVIGTDCIGSCKSNYHTIMSTTTPQAFIFFRAKLTSDYYDYILTSSYVVKRFIRVRYKEIECSFLEW